MARVAISEYKAKSLLLGDQYQGAILTSENFEAVAKKLDDEQRYVVKVDQGVKKRFKQGLLAVDVKPRDIPKHVKAFEEKGYSQFLVEPFLVHELDAERYLSFERRRSGIQILYSTQGGIEVEQGSPIKKLLYKGYRQPLEEVAQDLDVQVGWLEDIITRFNDLHMSFLEINPLAVIEGEPFMLDAAAEMDSAAAYFMNEWSLDDVVSPTRPTAAELGVAELAANSASSFSLKVVHQDGGLGMLLSGGGASVAIADEVCNLGQAKNLLNYGEYSGNPTTEETRLYTEQVLSLLLGSKAKRKALVIAGGVANFTDIKKTFRGVIEALTNHTDGLKKQHVKVFVRRGGPNEAEGLAMMRDFLKANDLYGDVVGSEELLTHAAAKAVEYIA